MTTMTYTATSLEDIAKQFDRLANVAEGFAAADMSKQGSAVHLAGAQAFRVAAEILRNTELVKAEGRTDA